MKRSRFSEEQIPSSSCRWTKRIPELGLTAKRVAAWRRDMPDKTIFTIRIRKSCEIVMHNPPSGESNHEYPVSQSNKDNSDSINLGSALAGLHKRGFLVHRSDRRERR